MREADVELSDEMEAMRKASGFPTFAQWKKDPSLYRQAHDMWANAVEQGKLCTNYKEQKHFVQLPSGKWFACGKSIVKAMKIFSDEGYQMQDLIPLCEIMEGMPLPWVKITWKVNPNVLKKVIV